MEVKTTTRSMAEFDPDNYLRILIAIAKSDPENGEPEFHFVRQQARRRGLDYEKYLASTEKSYLIGNITVSRRTALTILRDAIHLASMDGNFTLREKERVYAYAEKLDIPRNDVDRLEVIVREFRTLKERWRQLISLG
jgi:hypothetical protein